MFVEREPVAYQDMCGAISFIGKSYVVIEIPSNHENNPARLVVYRENYEDIIKLNEK